MNTIDYEKYKKDIENCFNLLVKKYNYKIISKTDKPYGYTIIYMKDDRKVYLSYDFKENFFYFNLIKGVNTVYPNDNDSENIKSFYELFKKNENKIDFKSLQPSDNDYLTALNKNALLLDKYGYSILKGEKWL